MYNAVGYGNIMIRCANPKKLFILPTHYLTSMEAITMVDVGDMLYSQIVNNIKEVRNMQQTDLMQYREESDRNLRILDSAYGNITSSEVFFPAIYFIEPTNACNLGCVMCPNSRLSNNKCFMDFDLFKKIIDEIKYVAKLIRLNYRGEPLFHPNIIEMIQYCKDNTFARISLSTNGTLLDTKLSKKLISAGIDEIIFSLDANSPETYYKIKHSEAFDKVVKNIINFLEMNTNNNVRVIVKLIQMDMNKDEIELFKNRWGNYNCEVKISWMNTWANQLPNNQDFSDNLCPNIGKPKIPCADLWYKMVITADGFVPLCCYDFMVKHLLGNINISDIRDIWNDREVQFFRKMHTEYAFRHLELCKNCGEYSRKRDVIEYLDIKEFPVGRP
ncbi:radical SAM protein [Dehalococcoidia bacterium]|nr:radical SAM protein [Dehalococcoidia bacterium]